MKNTENFQLETRLKKHRDFWGSKLTAAENETMERHIEFLLDSGALDKVLKKAITLLNLILKIKTERSSHPLNY
ncbi:hypothetical protein [Chryseobacterium wanjuense]